MRKLPETETGIKQAIKEYLTLKGVFWWYNVQGLGSQRGISDLMCLKDGVLYALEVKTEKGRLSDKQAEFLAQVNQNGGIGRVVRSIEDVQKILQFPTILRI